MAEQEEGHVDPAVPTALCIFANLLVHSPNKCCSVTAVYCDGIPAGVCTTFAITALVVGCDRHAAASAQGPLSFKVTSSATGMAQAVTSFGDNHATVYLYMYRHLMSW
jgi:hypothetical protein